MTNNDNEFYSLMKALAFLGCLLIGYTLLVHYTYPVFISKSNHDIAREFNA